METKKKSKRKILLIILLIIAILTAVWYGWQVHASHALLRRMENMTFDELIREALAGEEDAAVTVGILKNGEMSFTVYGADGQVSEPVEYRYEIGSITKTITASLIGQAVLEGKIALTDTIDRYLDLPEGKVYPTIEALLTHTSGLKAEYTEWSMLPYLFDQSQNPFKGIKADTLLGQYEQVKIKDGKEYKYNYSNYGTALLGLVLEEVYGCDYRSLANEYMQNELGLTDTCISGGDADFEGNWEWEQNDAYLAVGAVVSDVSDMLNYAAVQLGDDPAATLCHQPLKAINGSDEWDRLEGMCVDEIGMIWVIDNEHGFIWHNGGTGVHSSYLGFCPRATAFTFMTK